MECTFSLVDVPVVRDRLDPDRHPLRYLFGSEHYAASSAPLSEVPGKKTAPVGAAMLYGKPVIYRVPSDLRRNGSDRLVFCSTQTRHSALRAALPGNRP